MNLYNWPFSDITPNDISRFASKGRWDLIKKAIRLASLKETLKFNKDSGYKLLIDIRKYFGNAGINLQEVTIDGVIYKVIDKGLLKAVPRFIESYKHLEFTPYLSPLQLLLNEESGDKVNNLIYVGFAPSVLKRK